MRIAVGILACAVAFTTWAQNTIEADRPLGLVQLRPFPYSPVRSEDFIELPDGDLLLAAASKESLALRLRPDGTERWATLLPQFDLTAVSVKGDGGLVLAGAGPASDGSDYATTLIWMDSNGREQRRQVVGGGAPANTPGLCNCDVAYQMVATPDGGYLLVGASSHRPGGPKQSPSYGGLDGWIIKVDAQGNREWDRSYGGSGYDILLRGARLSDDGFILAGFSTSPADGSRTVSSPQNRNHFWLIRTDSTGQQLWESSLLDSFADGMLQEFLVTKNGDFVLAGYRGLLLRTTPTGELLWQRQYGPWGASLLRELPDGRLIHASSVEIFDGTQRPPSRTVIRCVSAEGGLLWEKTISNTGGINVEAAALPASDGSLWFATRGPDDLVIGQLAPEVFPNSGTELAVREIPEFRVSEPYGYFSVTGVPSTQFVWERSTDLSSWVPVSTNKLGTHGLNFSANTGESSSRQFFRARALP